VVTEGDPLEFTIGAFDSNFTSVTLSTAGLPNAVFVDSGNGVGVFTFTPDLTQEGVYNLAFIASDGVLADTGVVAITVLPGCTCPNQADFDEDDLVTAVDLAELIDIVFFGGAGPCDPCQP